MIGKTLKYSILTASWIVMTSLNPALIAMDYTWETDQDTMRSENKRSRGGKQPTYLMLHCVGLPDEWVKENYCYSEDNGGLGVSAHFYVSQESKKIFQMVPEEESAVHAGKSAWRGSQDLNDISIGVEFGYPGYAQIDGKAYYPYSFPSPAFSEEQIQAGITLCKEIMKRHNIPPEKVVWHSDVAPDRKTDPSPLFPARKFAENGIGVWPSSDPLPDSQLDTSLRGIQQSLKNWGYSLEVTGNFDQPTKDALIAHCMHYLPEAVNWSEFKEKKQGTIFDNKEWQDFLNKKELAISLDNLNGKNFVKYKF